MTTLSKTVRKTNAYDITVWNLKKIQMKLSPKQKETNRKGAGGY